MTFQGSAMITTTLGPMEEGVLEKRTGGDENETEAVEWVEYWYEGQLVHRSVHVTKKQPVPGVASVVGDFR